MAFLQKSSSYCLNGQSKENDIANEDVIGYRVKTRKVDLSRGIENGIYFELDGNIL